MKVKRIYSPAKRRQMQEEAEARLSSQEQDVNDFYWSGIGTLYNQIEYYLDKKAFFIGLCYFCVSFCLPFLNKTVLTVFNFNYLFFILSLQMIATLIMIDIASVTGLIKVKHIEWTDCLRCWKVSLCYGLNAAIGLHSIAGLNIAVIDMLKRLGPFINLMLAHYLLGFDFTLNFTTTGIYMSAAGCVIGALGDTDSHFYLYGLTVLGVLIQSYYQTEVERLSLVTELNTFELLYINAMNTTPILLALLAFTGQYRLAFIAEAWSNPSFIVLLAIVLTFGVLLNYLLFLCSIRNTALTTSMIGVTKSTLTSFIGLFCFDTFHPTHMFLFGLALNMVGALVYMHSRYSAARDLYETQLEAEEDEERNLARAQPSTQTTTGAKYSQV